MDSEEIMEGDSALSSSDEENDVDMHSLESEERKKLKERAAELENKVEKDRTDYQSYVDLIYVYMTLRQLESLRSVCYRFKDEYPLTPEIWLSWIKYEIKLATTLEEKEIIKCLFDEAVQDYLSVDLWLEYIQFCISLMADDNNSADDIRLILERAILACGAHVSKGVLIWDMYKEFEKSILNSLMQAGNAESEIISEQQRRVTELYRRQLMIPLFDMNKTFAEFQEWRTQMQIDIDVDTMCKNYEAAFDKLNERLPYEEILVNSEPGNNVEEYLKYLRFELNCDNKVTDFFRIRCLFERAVSEHPLDTDLWVYYTDFMETHIKVPEDILSVFYRSVRNCSWSVKCWNAYLLALERYKRPKERLLSVLEKALTSSFEQPADYRQLWISYLSYLRRQLDQRVAAEDNNDDDDDSRIKYLEEIRNVVNRACNHLASYFGELGDPDSRLLLWLAKFEVNIGKDVENYRNAWEKILNSDKNRHSSYYWLKYVSMENELDYEKKDQKIRKLYAKALALDTDSPQLIAYEWLDFESLKGDFDKFEYCQKSVMSRLKSLQRKKNRELEERVKPSSKTRKDKIKETYKSSFVKQNADNKKTKKEDKGANVEKKLDDESCFKKPTSVVDKKPEQAKPYFTPDADKENRTVFLSNLSFHSTEDDIKAVLCEAGTVEEVRLVKDYKGSSKGYGFVVFSSQTEAEKAIKMDRTPLDKRPLFISHCNVEKGTRKTGIRFNTGLEKNKLFVKGLPLNFEQKDVRAIFEPYGSLKDVRIVTYRNGFSKGLAYVEYNDEDSAANALLKTDGLTVQDCVLKVDLSNPPEKKDKSSLLTREEDPNTNVKQRLAPVINKFSKESEPRRHARTQISLVPRALQVNSKASKLQPNNSEKMDCTDNPSTSSSSDQNANNPGKRLTNEDFRKMLLDIK